MKKRHIILLYGSTGDLAIKKILPAVTSLLEDEEYSKDFAILALGRKNFDTIKYLEFAKSINPSVDIEKLKDHVGYLNMDVSSAHDYYLLKNVLKDLSDLNTKVVHFFALAPNLILKVAKNLVESSIVSKQSVSHRIIIEKPFGTDRCSAKKLKKNLWKFLSEKQIYRMDHYLGKDVIKQIFSMRFEDGKVSELFETQKIKTIKIYAFEKDGVLNRGDYYDKSGAVRDMIQSHLLQIASLLLMDEPKCNECDELIDAKVSAVKKLYLSKDCCLFGQYADYKFEKNVSRKTKTETLAFVRLGHKKLKQVPIYLFTGKKMEKRNAGAVVLFENGDELQFDFDENKITLISKEKQEIIYQKPAFMPYAQLINEAFESDKRSFVRFDEIEYAWKIVDKIQKRKKNLFEYRSNVDIAQKLNVLGLQEFDELLL